MTYHYTPEYEKEAQNNLITDVRSPKKQRNYEDWELKLMKFCSEQNIPCGIVAKALSRSVITVSRKSAQIGYKLAQ